jgi:hypothetical protein
MLPWFCCCLGGSLPRRFCKEEESDWIRHWTANPRTLRAWKRQRRRFARMIHSSICSSVGWPRSSIDRFDGLGTTVTAGWARIGTRAGVSQLTNQRGGGLCDVAPDSVPSWAMQERLHSPSHHFQPPTFSPQDDPKIHASTEPTIGGPASLSFRVCHWWTWTHSSTVELGVAFRNESGIGCRWAAE